MQPHTHTLAQMHSVAVCNILCVAEGIITSAVQEKQNEVKPSAELFLTAFTVRAEVIFMAASDQER